MKNLGNYLFVFIFFIISVVVIFTGESYKNDKIREYKSNQLHSTALALSSEVATLIQEKKNATLALALAFTQNTSLILSLFEDSSDKSILTNLSYRIRDNSEYKNVWLQLLDKNGNSIARSWDSVRGDNLSKIRSDVRSMINKHEIKTSISVGTYDMSFKAMVPVFDEDKAFIGSLEVITHFNSIAKKIKSKGFEPVILVDKKYKKQITRPFTNKFSGDYYVANKNANDTLIEFISLKGLEHFITPKDIYKVDKDNGYYIINYTLFDIEDKPMANFLMFRPLENISFTSIENIELSVNFLMALFILGAGFVLYFLSNKDTNLQEYSQGKVNVLFFIVAFLLTSTLYYLFLSWNYEKKEKEYLSTYNKNIYNDYEIIHEKFSTVAQTMFQTTVNQPEVIELIEDSYKSQKDKDLAREKLYTLLIDEYEYFKEHDLRQLHFHLKNNESFLRFHRPAKYGDDLSGVRSTVEWVNSTHAQVTGFEEGRIYNGFRYVFPLSTINLNNEKTHLGSVETSFSAYAIAKEFANSHDTKAGFIINADVVDAKVFKDEHSNYMKSEFSGFYYESSIKKQLEHAFRHIDTDLLNYKDVHTVGKKISAGEIFSISSKNRHTLFTFIPIRNPISSKVVAAIILQVDDMIFINLKNNFLIFLLIGITTILFIYLYVFREYMSKLKFQFLSFKTQKIIDSQTSIVVITDGIEMIDVNKRFLDFSGFASIDAFKNVHDCICEMFEEDDKFFHLGKVQEGVNWIHTLEKLPKKDHIVSIKDKDDIKHTFSVSMNQFNKDYIITLTDISDTMTEHFSLEEKVTRDKLTSAYNREYFENNIHLLIQSAQQDNLLLGLMIFDIDHFKEVNDTYGHNCGDNVLVDIVKVVSKNIRKDDILIRWGGEEFIILARIDSLEHLRNIAEHLRKRIEKYEFDEVNQLTCSFGVTLFDDEFTIKEIIKRADDGLYEAKHSGRNRVVAK